MSGYALMQALELAETPALVGLLRRQKLPDDILLLIRIAAGNEDAIADATAHTGRSRESLREASVLYLQQILFQPQADPYRILGASSATSQEQLHQHMRWLMKWLHPDRDRNDWESAFAERVSGAWEVLKTAERRANYDRLHGQQRPPDSGRRVDGRRSRRRRPRGPFLRLPRIDDDRSVPSRRRRWWIVGAAVALVIAVAALTILLPDGEAGRLLGQPMTTPTAGLP
jgi:hypothetical protein